MLEVGAVVTTVLSHDPRKAYKAKRRQQTERNLHTAVAEFLDRSLPDASYWFPVPSASMRNVIQAVNMKRAGELKVGTPDLCIVHRGRAIFIELKSPKGNLTDSQKEAQKQILLAGACTTIARSVEDVAAFLGMLMPLKGRPQ